MFKITEELNIVDMNIIFLRLFLFLFLHAQIGKISHNNCVNSPFKRIWQFVTIQYFTISALCAMKREPPSFWYIREIGTPRKRIRHENACVGIPPQNSLRGTKLASIKSCENHLIQFFNQKPQKLYTNEIMALPEKWRNIVDNNGEYLVWIN